MTTARISLVNGLLAPGSTVTIDGEETAVPSRPPYDQIVRALGSLGYEKTGPVRRHRPDFAEVEVRPV
jgi:hypothetical protein